MITPVRGAAWLRPDASFAHVGHGTATGPLAQLALAVELRRIGKLGKAYLRWTERMLHQGDLSPRQKRLIALRAAWRNGCVYEWVHHARLAGQAGIGPGELLGVAQTTNAEWSDEHVALMAAVDDLLAHGTLSEAAWNDLGRYLNEVQRIEFCMVAGHSRMLSLILNSLDLPLDIPVQPGELPPAGRLETIQIAYDPAAVPSLPGYPDGNWRVMDVPRVAPLESKDANLLQRAFLLLSRRAAGSRSNLNVIATLMHMGKIFPWHLMMLSQLLGKGRLPRAEKEQVIMRVGWRTGNPYEWAHHAHMGRTAGMTVDEVAAVALEDSTDWTPRQRAMFRAADAMLANGQLDRTGRAALLEHLDGVELIEFCFIVGHYSMIALTNNSLGVAVEPAFDPARAH